MSTPTEFDKEIRRALDNAFSIGLAVGEVRYTTEVEYKPEAEVEVIKQAIDQYIIGEDDKEVYNTGGIKTKSELHQWRNSVRKDQRKTLWEK
jgi:hypothetical protein